MLKFFKHPYDTYAMFAIGILLIFVWAWNCKGLWSKKSKKEGFENNGLESEYITANPYKFHMYYADWCPHCTTAKPEFAKLGAIQTIAGKKVECSAIEAEKNPEKVLGKVSGYPTIQLYNPEGKLVDEYSGPRTQAGFQSYLEDVLNRPSA